jgi:signal transduction histidine kinase
MFRGPHDEAYFQRRARIGHIHVKIDLPQVYMFTAMDRIRVQTQSVLRDSTAFDAEKAKRVATALDQILDIELAIMLETYREDLVAKNRTAERLATIGQLAAGIGHELRNPLGVVESSAFLVTRRLEQLQVSDASVARHMEKIAVEVQRSNKTISDLLELARSRPLSRRAVPARTLLDAAVPAANLPAGVTVEIDAAPELTLDCDPDQLTRVLTNLLINASQAMAAAGTSGSTRAARAPS